MASASLLQAAPSAPPDNEQHHSKSFQWIPTISLKIGWLHFWLGKTLADGRNVYVLLEERASPQLSFTLHWLTDETPMFSLHLYPVIVAHVFWLHSHDISKE